MLFVRRNDWATMSFSRRTRYRGAIQGGVCHWPGMNFTINNQQDEINLLNGILRSHRAGVYNDIAYNFAFGRYGHVYELRGAEYQSGAHSPLNGTHEAYLFLCSTDEQPPKSMLNTATAFILTRKTQGVGDDMRAHSDVKSTACPGGPIKSFMSTINQAKPVPPTKPIKGVKVKQQQAYNATVKIDSSGNGYVDVYHDQKKDPIANVATLNGNNPAKEGYPNVGKPNVLVAGFDGTYIRVTVTGANPNVHLGVSGIMCW